MSIVTVNDLISRWRSLTTDEIAKAAVLIDDYEAELNIYAKGKGYDIEEMLLDVDFKQVYKSVICSAVAEQMANEVEAPTMSQMSQSALGYSVSGTFLNPGGGLFIRNNLLKQLGLMKQKVKAVNMYGSND